MLLQFKRTFDVFKNCNYSCVGKADKAAIITDIGVI